MQKKLLVVALALCVFSLLAVPQNQLLASGPGGCEPDDEVCINNYYSGNSDVGGGGISTLLDVIGVITTVANSIVPFIIGLAILVILWGVFRYIATAGEEEKRAESRMFIIYGIIGLFIMVSIWGLVNVVRNTLNFSDKSAPAVESIFPTVAP